MVSFEECVMRKVFGACVAVLGLAGTVLAQTPAFEVNSPAATAWAAVDFSALMSALAGVLGTVVALAVGLYFAFLAVRKALRWAGRAG